MMIKRLFFLFLLAGCSLSLYAQDAADIDTLYGQMVAFLPIKGDSFNMEVANRDGSNVFYRKLPVKDFYMARTEVTQSLWRAVMGTNPSYFAGCDDCPVEMVSYDEVFAFINKLNMSSKLHVYELPDEVEWTYAASGGRNSSNNPYSGSDDLNDVAWTVANAEQRTHPVATKQPNELGLYDMSGNVWEWCMNWPGWRSVDETMAWMTPDNTSRACRGGCWISDEKRCHPQYRQVLDMGMRYSGVGFRLCRLR